MSCISGNALSVKLCNCTKFHYSYKKVDHGVVSYTIFMFIPKTGCAKMHCACAVNICQVVLYLKMLSRSWSTTVPKTMLVSGIAESIENMALSRSANIRFRHNFCFFVVVVFSAHLSESSGWAIVISLCLLSSVISRPSSVVSN